MPPQTNLKTRVAGVYTYFHWDGKLIAYADEVRVAGVTPVAPAQVIQPMNATRPLEIVTPGAHTNGSITLVLTELYGQAVWQRLSKLTGSENVVEIMKTIAGLDAPGITVTKFVTPPHGTPYSESYYNCVIVRADESENIRVDTMSVNKEVEIWYTHSDKSWIPGTEA